MVIFGKNMTMYQRLFTKKNVIGEKYKYKKLMGVICITNRKKCQKRSSFRFTEERGEKITKKNSKKYRKT